MTSSTLSRHTAAVTGHHVTQVCFALGPQTGDA
ncbi:hypothetical protein STIAU_6266 [Stigmatella aurantiaca DW4/3-1]|uniref:Uncharacterized protein n=1 Tax=Stigmatella aurantiaca (strain DW4/3-1) TaxID=378806 RepID=Q08U41_STIAD|nr:hypothetical protein STIAU_6266 [Stigmatella aurantiaca DW4/3-1]